MKKTLRFSFLYYMLVLSATGAPRTLSDQKLFATGKTFSEVCAAAALAKARLVVSQKWSVSAATCTPGIEFSKTGSITYSGPVILSGSVSGTFDMHFVREPGGTLSISDKSSTLYLSWWGAVADGTDESTKFQAALDAAHTSGGGRISISYRPSCYLAQNLLFYSNTTIFADSQATCVKKPDGGALYQIFHNDYAAPVSNVHFENFTIDGNRDKQPGVTGDSGLIGIYFAGASDSTIERMVIRNNYTDGVLIGCWGYYPDHMTGVGANVRILQSVITNSRRNNVSVICSRGTVIQDSELSYANGTLPEAGVDVEPDYAAQVVDGFRIIDTEVHHNAGDGVLLQPKADNEALSVVNVYSHDNGKAGLYCADIGRAGELGVSGGVFGNNRGAAGITLAGWGRAMLSGESTYGSSRGILVMANNSGVLLGPGVASGTLYDLSVDGPNSVATLYGLWLARGVIQAGGDNCIPYFPEPLELKIGCTIASDGK